MFLQPQSLTIPTEKHDYPEWHKGRSRYALWYIEIEQPEILQYLQHLRQQLSPYLFQPNTRQFHITLFICGFWHENSLSNIKNSHGNVNIYNFDDDFSQQQLQQQLEALKQITLKPFQLKTGKINSFDSALFLEIIDFQNSLSKLRSKFSEHNSEIAPLGYCPHITLGLYSERFGAEEIFNQIESIEQKSFDLNVKHLTFGYYQAQILQGELTVLEHIQLNPTQRRDALKTGEDF